jgi:hypothetical protein
VPLDAKGPRHTGKSDYAQRRPVDLGLPGLHVDRQPDLEWVTTKTDSGNGDQHESASSNGTVRAEATRPLTVMLPEDLLRKLRVIAVVRGRSISEIVLDHVEALVKRDLKKTLAKLDI